LLLFERISEILKQIKREFISAVAVAAAAGRLYKHLTLYIKQGEQGNIPIIIIYKKRSIRRENKYLYL
jgi:hypothetical protein